MLSALAAAALAGAALGLEFNPLAALAAAAGAAALSGYGGAPRSRPWWSALLVIGAWLIGDSLPLLAAFEPGTPAPARLALAVQALVAVTIGYATPALAGIYVGRRVHRGTGWLSAITVAVGVSGALSFIGPAAAAWLLAASRALEAAS